MSMGGSEHLVDRQSFLEDGSNLQELNSEDSDQH